MSRRSLTLLVLVVAALVAVVALVAHGRPLAASAWTVAGAVAAVAAAGTAIVLARR